MNVEKICAVLVLHMQQTVIIKKDVVQTAMHWASCAMLSGVSWVTLHRIFTSAILSEKYYDNTDQNFFMRNVVRSLFDNISQRFLPKSIRTTLNRIFFL